MRLSSLIPAFLIFSVCGVAQTVEPLEICVPYRVEAANGSKLENWCGLGPTAVRFFEETYEEVKGNFPEWVANGIKYHPVIIQTVYSIRRSCHPTLEYAVMGEVGKGYFLIVHPQIFRSLDAQGLARALTLLAQVIQWRYPPNVGRFYGCLE